MRQLFNSYIAQGKTKEALIVGQNALNRGSCDVDIFNMYYDLLIELCNKADNHNIKTDYWQQASAALAFFSDNAELDESVVSDILEKEKQLNDIYQKLLEDENRLRSRNETSAIEYNNQALDLVKRLIEEKLKKASNRNDFNHVLEQISKIDKSLKQDYLTDQQKDNYDNLTKTCSETVSAKLKEFEDKSNKEYNIKAVEAYERAFQFFKNASGEEFHKDIIKDFFSFDVSRLYNETIIYYNHVYNYIMNKLDDDGKFKFTKYAILSEKRR